MFQISPEERVQYIKTIVITLVVLIITIGIIVWRVADTTHDRINKLLSSKLMTEAERSELDRLYYQEKLYPDDFMINLKIALIHEFFKEPELAKMNYDKALLKAPKNPFVLYRVAIFYVNRGDFPQGIYLIETLTDKPDEQILNIKTSFYAALSNALVKSDDLPGAVNTSKLAAKYARVISKAKYKTAQGNLAKMYSLCGDWWMKRGDVEQAIVALRNSLAIENSSEVKYKLALVYLNKYPKASHKLMEDIFNSKDAEIVNIEVYYDLITRLYNRAIEEDNPTDAAYYDFREKILKKFIVKNYLFTDELKLLNMHIAKQKSKNLRFNRHYISLDLKNTSKDEINSLWLKVVFEPPVGGEKVMVKKVATVLDVLKPNEAKKGIHFNIDGKTLKKKSTLKSTPGFARLTIYAKKRPNFEWVQIYRGVISF